jgi:triacylglycerol esterase/lipase EstA (alpha/beta hydrolase family)
LKKLFLLFIISCFFVGCVGAPARDRTDQKLVPFDIKYSSIISGTVRSDDLSDVRVVTMRQVKGEWRFADYAAPFADGSYYLFVRSGRFKVFAFRDINGNNIMDDGEPGAFYNFGNPIEVTSGMTVMDIDFEVGTASLSQHQEIDLGKGENFTYGMEFPEPGKTVTMNSELFLKKEKFGKWYPVEMFKHTPPNIFFLEPYDEKRIPILFVHGIWGTPDDFKYFVSNIDRTKYQIWFYHYPTGLRLEPLAEILYRRMKELHKKYGFEKLVVTAHSMGGLVSRSYINKSIERGLGDYISLYITISTPWDGSELSQRGVRRSPFLIPGWQDVATGSNFIKDLGKIQLPETIPFYLFFSFSGNSTINRDSDDGVISIRSQLSYHFQDQAQKIYGSYEDHVSILEDRWTFNKYKMILEETFREPDAAQKEETVTEPEILPEENNEDHGTEESDTESA